MKNFYADCMHLTNRGVLCEFSLKKRFVLTYWLYLQVERLTFRKSDLHLRLDQFHHLH